MLASIYNKINSYHETFENKKLTHIKKEIQFSK